MKCQLCPLRCGADRPLAVGVCGADKIRIAKYGLFKFEEPPISFGKGSGSIFFYGCSLKCKFCQNYEISHFSSGKVISPAELAEIFRELEDTGAENINLVNPTHYLRDIAEAIKIYRPEIPVVYNTHGYETKEGLKLAASFTDIWLTDMKFTDPFLSKRYTGRSDYPDYAKAALEFMAEKPLKMREDGKMLTGCIVRHLVLPQAVYDSLRVIEFVSKFNDRIFFSLMSQYTPHGDISEFKELQRKITHREYLKALEAVRASGLKNVFIQDFSSAEESFIPHWDY